MANDTDTTSTELWDKPSLLVRLGNNEALVNTVIDLFLNQAPEQLQALVDAINSGDMDPIKNHSHKLKGSAGDLSLTKLHLYASAMEEYAMQGDTTSIHDLLPVFHKVAAESIACLTAAKNA